LSCEDDPRAEVEILHKEVARLADLVAFLVEQNNRIEGQQLMTHEAIASSSSLL
jgi:hypothetical protein